MGSAETVAPEGSFELATIGNAFHRLDRDVVARHLAEVLQPGGCVALLWSESPWRGNQPWQRAMAELVQDWQRRLGALDRVPEGWEEALNRTPHAEVLRRAGFEYEGRGEFAVSREWTLESLLGFVYSTSILNLGVLDALQGEFETDLHRHLGDTAGTFTQETTCAYDLARRTLA